MKFVIFTGKPEIFRVLLKFSGVFLWESAPGSAGTLTRDSYAEMLMGCGYVDTDSAAFVAESYCLPPA